MFTPFQLLLWSLFTFLKMAIWFHFSENGPDMDKKVTPYVNVHNLPYVLLYNYLILQNWKNERKNIQFNFSKLNLPLHNLFWQVTHMDSSPLKWKKRQPPSKNFLRTKKYPHSLGLEDTMEWPFFII